MFRETKARSVAKTVSWRFWATATTVVLVLIFVGKPGIALAVGGTEVIVKLIVYYFHERAWNKIKFGRKEIKPAVIWLTGLPKSGKSEIGDAIAESLKNKGLKVEHLDGHAVRHLFPETGFSKNEVNEHIKRVGYLASKLEKQGVFVVASFVSPFRDSREFVKKNCENFVEVHVSTPLEVCEQRDTSGLYLKARNGEIKNLPGIDVEYEIPQNGALVVDTGKLSVSEAANFVLERVRGY